MMKLMNISEKVIFINDENEINNIVSFLNKNGLDFDHDAEYTMALYDDLKIIGTGSFSGNVLKCIAIDEEYKGLGLANKIITNLVNEQYRRGRTHLFIYTTTKNETMFQNMGFFKIAEAESRAILLENRKNGIKKYLRELEHFKIDGKQVSCIVMNCNPFTLGHRYLIERASSLSDILHIFVVWENRSSFPAEDRFNMVKEGTKHLTNAYIHKGKDYIISNATFPSYFIKDSTKHAETHCMLDIEIFGRYISHALNITKRFVGEEPFCPVTHIYNETMKRLLPEYGIEVIEIPRIGIDKNIISATKVREFIKKGDFDSVKRLVPKSTFDYLLLKETQPIIERIKSQQ